MNATTPATNTTTTTTNELGTLGTTFATNFCTTADILKDVQVFDRFLPNGIGGVLTIEDDATKPQVAWAILA